MPLVILLSEDLYELRRGERKIRREDSLSRLNEYFRKKKKVKDITNERKCETVNWNFSYFCNSLYYGVKGKKYFFFFLRKKKS